jgi:diacylglycerol kinase family enzyme
VALRDFPRHKPNIELDIEGSQERASTVLVQFRSVYTYFGVIPIRITPDEPDPMTVLTMASLRRRRIPRIIATALRNGDLSSIPEWTVFRHVKSLDMEADPEAAAQADGESLGMVDGGRIEWAPDSLRVVAGQPAA